MITTPNGIRFLDFFAGFGGSSSGLVEAGYELATAFNHWDKAIAVHSANQIVNVSAAHVYSPTNAPAAQWRDRIYIVLSRKGIRMRRIEPRPPAWCDQCQAVVEAVQSWKRDTPIRVGKYGRQYVYVCSAGQHARQIVEPYVLPAAAVIDWSDLGERIGDRKRPLAAATMRRIEVGARMFARPAVVAHHGETWDAANLRHPRHGDPDAYYRVWSPDAAPLMARNGSGGDALSVPPFLTAVNHDADHRAQDLGVGPLPTRSTKIGDGLVFPPYITHHYGDGHGRNGDRRVTDADMPLGAMTTTMSQGIAVPPYIVEYFGTSTARDADQPLSAVLAGAQHHGLAIPPGAFLSKHHGGLDYRAIEHMNKAVTEPMPTIVASPNVSLIIPTRKRPDSVYEGELPFDIDDVRFRMLGPTEHLRAQRFWEGYDTSAANKSETTKGAGNAVPVNVAHWIGTEVADALGAAA